MNTNLDSSITRGFLALMSWIFGGFSEQCDRQAKQFIAYYAPDRLSDSLERKIEDIALGKRTRL